MTTQQHEALVAVQLPGERTLLDCIGNTPLIRLRRIGDHLRDVTFYAKAEWFNPGGSVKDRDARGIVLDALARGKLGGGRALIDSTSGNTGIAYAMLGAALDFPVELVMPANVSEERRAIVAAYGARLTLSSPYEGSDGAIREVRRLVTENPDAYFYADQYNNDANWRAHYATTGVELLRQTGGDLTHVLAGLGTSGTIMGVGRRLKEHNRAIQVIGVQPGDPMDVIEGLKHMETAIVPGIFDPSLLDEKLLASTEEAYAAARLLARTEGMFLGQSCGAVMHAALQLAERVRRGRIVMIFPDAGDKYISTGLWRREDSIEYHV